MKPTQYTSFRPGSKPLIVWDGTCGFCKYWILKWKVITKDKIDYATYQETAPLIEDMEVDTFKRAVQMIMPDGRVYSGAAAAFKSMTLGADFKLFEKLYNQSGLFRKVSDMIYQWITEHRPFMYKLTTFLFGKNPLRPAYKGLLSLALLVIAGAGLGALL
jgi:predicted DCC family thiol-disulfide oxidoreductase YuxK